MCIEYSSGAIAWTANVHNFQTTSISTFSIMQCTELFPKSLRIINNSRNKISYVCMHAKVSPIIWDCLTHLSLLQGGANKWPANVTPSYCLYNRYRLQLFLSLLLFSQACHHYAMVLVAVPSQYLKSQRQIFRLMWPQQVNMTTGAGHFQYRSLATHMPSSVAHLVSGTACNFLLRSLYAKGNYHHINFDFELSISSYLDPSF